MRQLDHIAFFQKETLQISVHFSSPRAIICGADLGK